MTKNKKIGIAFLLSPWIGLILSFTLYFIARLVAASTAPEVIDYTIQTEPVTSTILLTSTPPLEPIGLSPAPPLWTQIVRVVASLLGTLSVIFIFVGTGLGIYFMSKAEEEQHKG